MAMCATEILHTASECIGDRAKQRDQKNGERSMARAVWAFNDLTGSSLSPRDGWLFMAILKAARATTPNGRHNADDYVDGAAYFALAGEQAEQDHGPKDSDGGTDDEPAMTFPPSVAAAIARQVDDE